MTQCSKCGHPLADAHTVEEQEALTAQPCPNCGGFGRSMGASQEETITFRDGNRFKLKRQGERTAYVEGVNEPLFSHDRGKLVHQERLIDRDNDAYAKDLTDYETGEVFYTVREPLSKHQGRGDAKLKKPKGAS